MGLLIEGGFGSGDSGEEKDWAWGTQARGEGWPGDSGNEPAGIALPSLPRV